MEQGKEQRKVNKNGLAPPGNGLSITTDTDITTPVSQYKIIATLTKNPKIILSNPNRLEHGSSLIYSGTDKVTAVISVISY
jgi:hypothetical protein